MKGNQSNDRKPQPNKDGRKVDGGRTGPPEPSEVKERPVSPPPPPKKDV